MRISTVLLVLTALRLLFFVVHRHAFSGYAWTDLLQAAVQGLRFDAITVVIANAPLILLHLLPLQWRAARWYDRMLFVLFITVNGFLPLLCCIDLPLFGFIGTRTHW
ncbi:MAG: hypothetical protein IPL52_10430 [Flavobacteriales bacterium]|nr:hypothetical protein [Flavobacteriales bacterium]